MSASTLHLPVSSRFVDAGREVGTSALDRRLAVWPAPDPSTVVSDPLAPLTAPARRPVKSVLPWPAPEPSMRVEMAPPTALRPGALEPPPPTAVPISTVEPLHAVSLPDLVALARTHEAAPGPVVDVGRSSIPSKPVVESEPAGLRPPTLDELVVSDADAAQITALPEHAAPDDRRVARRVVTAIAVGLGACAATAAALTVLF